MVEVQINSSASTIHPRRALVVSINPWRSAGGTRRARIAICPPPPSLLFSSSNCFPTPGRHVQKNSTPSSGAHWREIVSKPRACEAAAAPSNPRLTEPFPALLDHPRRGECSPFLDRRHRQRYRRPPHLLHHHITCRTACPYQPLLAVHLACLPSAATSRLSHVSHDGAWRFWQPPAQRSSTSTSPSLRPAREDRRCELSIVR